MKKILWLASWYPSRVDAYTGDFIQRHAQAAALENEIKVLHVVKNNASGSREKHWEEHIPFSPRGESTIIYYRTPGYAFRIIEKLYSNFLFLKLHARYIRRYIAENGKPDGIHVHIGMKSGLIALYAAWRYRIPYVLSEQWSGLCPEAWPGLENKPPVFRWLWKKVMQKARGYSAVSAYLAAAMQKRFSLPRQGSVIPNVVNNQIFFRAENSSREIQFIHISTLNYQKNVEQILEATAILKQRFPRFKLLIFGEPKLELLDLVKQLNIEDVIAFKKPRPQPELNPFLQQSTALILYSRFETFGCVIIEANACGKPVIVSDIPVFHEIVKDKLTGVFVPLNNAGLLADQLYSFATEPDAFDAAYIESYSRENYSFEVVGKQFDQFYREYFG